MIKSSTYIGLKKKRSLQKKCEYDMHKIGLFKAVITYSFILLSIFSVVDKQSIALISYSNNKIRLKQKVFCKSTSTPEHETIQKLL